LSAPAIRVSGLGKRYRIGERVRYKSLRESLSNAVTRTFRGGRRTEETIWALKDVSFEVAPGEVVGVIGRNGAGKSTLLKILSRITEPTEGRVELHGRVGSLLEVGTGFHLELTGRENIYLNGAILGMKRAEIDRKFDEIVAFAEIERFLDTPVKHYSTGMYLRLAFAVAAHLEPEILLVDEVLAVGDAEFQKKCLGKMGDVARGGRTVVFVSHDELAIRRLCSRSVVLEGGTILFVGLTEDAFSRYRASRHDPAFSVDLRTVATPVARITNAQLLLGGHSTTEFVAGQQPDLVVTAEVCERTYVSLEVLVRDENSRPLLFCPLGLSGCGQYDLAPGVYRFKVQLLLPQLASGRYSLDLILAEANVRFLDYVEQALVFVLAATALPATGWVFRQTRGQGAVLLDVVSSAPPEHVSALPTGLLRGPL
jgi:lipopolysaccharide transport system ATP-binding protein